jgi:hypothetical protein
MTPPTPRALSIWHTASAHDAGSGISVPTSSLGAQNAQI